MRELKLILGGEEISVRELPGRKNTVWRKQLDVPFRAMMEALRTTDIEMNKTSDIPLVLTKLQDLLIPNADIIPDIVISYSPVLEERRAWIDENATETEFLNAFVQIAGVAYPTDFFIQQVAGMRKLGSLRPPTSTN